MTESISPKTQTRIDSLLREIAAGQHIDADTIDELRVHMEEKYLAYMTGAETITEDDAMLLMREHFGKPEVIRACFEEHRERVTPMLFFRWFSAAAIMFVVCMIIQTMLQVEIAQIITLLLMILPLWFWRVREEKGLKVWYLSLPSWLLLSMVLILVFAVPIPIMRNIIHLSELERYRFFNGIGQLAVYPSTGIIMYQSVFILWWFDRRPRYVLVPLGVAAMIAFFSAVWAVENWTFAPLYGFTATYQIFWLALLTIMLLAAPVYLLVTAVFAWGRKLKLVIER